MGIDPTVAAGFHGVGLNSMGQTAKKYPELPHLFGAMLDDLTSSHLEVKGIESVAAAIKQTSHAVVPGLLAALGVMGEETTKPAAKTELAQASLHASVTGGEKHEGVHFDAQALIAGLQKSGKGQGL